MREDSANLQTTLENHFKWLHQHPELSYQEYQTTAYLREALERSGIEILDTPLKTGLVARITGGKPGPRIALRADIDALPITEETALPYKSCTEGMMHACGHDFHTASLLGAALLLKETAAAFAGEALLVFQPAEEVSGGAQSVLDTGILEGVRAIFGLHSAPEYASGTVALKAGGTFAAVVAFKIKIQGKGGHAAQPQTACDPIPALCALTGAAQTIVSRNTDPFDAAVLSITRLEAGSAWNIIPETAFAEGTIRALSSEKARDMAVRLSEICKGIETAYTARVSIDWWMDGPATNNDAALTEYVAQTARELNLTVAAYTPTMAGEDFALYQEKIPGVFINFGVGSPEGLHHPGFAADTAHLASAARLYAALAVGAAQYGI